MRTRQREVCRLMIKPHVPRLCRVTRQTGRRDPDRCMIRIRCSVVIRKVTINTLTGSPFKHPAHMTLLTGCLDMCTRQRELRVVMVERRVPVARCMALQTGCGHLRRFVIRIRRAVVIRKVAINTLTRGPFKHPAHMALLTGCLDMCTRQRELRVVMVERRVPVARCMALQTGCGHLCRCMIRIRCSVVIRKVAINTLTGSPFKHPAHMTLLTGCLDMCTRQREARCLMIKPHVPRLCRVTRQTGCRDPDRCVIRISRAVVI